MKPGIYKSDLRGTEPYGSFLSTTANRNTFLAWHYDLRLFVHFLRHRLPEDAPLPEPWTLATTDLAQFVASLLMPGFTMANRHREALSPRSIRRVMSSLESLYSFLIRLGRLTKERNPVEVFKAFRMRFQRRNPRPLPQRERERLVASLRHDTPADIQEALVVLLGYHCGLRVFEIAKARWEEIDFTAPAITLVGKGGRERTVPLTLLLMGFLRRWGSEQSRDRSVPPKGFLFPSPYDDARPVWPGTVQGWLKRIAARAMLANPQELAVHRLRHTFGTQLAESGAGVFQIKELMGHYSVAISEIYVSLAENKQKIADAHTRAFEDAKMETA